MLRIVIQDTDFGRAVNIGGPVENYIKTFDVDLPEVEKHLREYQTDQAQAKERKHQCWWHRQVIGVEVLP